MKIYTTANEFIDSNDEVEIKEKFLIGNDTYICIELDRNKLPKGKGCGWYCMIGNLTYTKLCNRVCMYRKDGKRVMFKNLSMNATKILSHSFNEIV